MTEQLTLIPQPPRLTDRQQLALEIIGQRQPITSEELGAALGANPRFLIESGREVGSALRRKKPPLVRYSRRHGGWTLTDFRPSREAAKPETGAAFGEFPPGY